MHNKTKAPAATGAIKETESNYQEGNPMKTSIPHVNENGDSSDARIHVAGLTVAPGVMTGGDLPDELVVALHTPDGLLSFSPAEACALAAALQAVGVFQMEQEPRTITRRTEPGQPEQDGIGGGL